MNPTGNVSITRRAAATSLLRVAAGAAALGDLLLRPGEVHPARPGEAGTEALVERIVWAGSELRAQLRLADGTRVWGRVERARAEELELSEGQILSVAFSARGRRGELPRAA